MYVNPEFCAELAVVRRVNKAA